ncbi:hypothetical protein [Paenibacillus sp. FSL H7-0714]|uniref:hypothetical protein n=1 Tax=Paenibacillus sp. FSL H7-0714 TaxID=2954735 RepID=UPI0030FB3489
MSIELHIDYRLLGRGMLCPRGMVIIRYRELDTTYSSTGGWHHLSMRVMNRIILTGAAYAKDNDEKITAIMNEPGNEAGLQA